MKSLFPLVIVVFYVVSASAQKAPPSFLKEFEHEKKYLAIGKKTEKIIQRYYDSLGVLMNKNASKDQIVNLPKKITDSFLLNDGIYIQSEIDSIYKSQTLFTAREYFLYIPLVANYYQEMKITKLETIGYRIYDNSTQGALVVFYCKIVIYTRTKEEIKETSRKMNLYIKYYDESKIKISNIIHASDVFNSKINSLLLYSTFKEDAKVNEKKLDSVVVAKANAAQTIKKEIPAKKQIKFKKSTYYFGIDAGYGIGNYGFYNDFGNLVEQAIMHNVTLCILPQRNRICFTYGMSDMNIIDTGYLKEGYFNVRTESYSLLYGYNLIDKYKYGVYPNIGFNYCVYNWNNQIPDNSYIAGIFSPCIGLTSEYYFNRFRVKKDPGKKHHEINFKISAAARFCHNLSDLFTYNFIVGLHVGYYEF